MLVCFNYQNEITKYEKIWLIEVDFLPRIGETVSIIDNNQRIDFTVKDVQTVLSKGFDDNKFHADYVVILSRKELEQYAYVAHPNIQPSSTHLKSISALH